MVPSIPRTIIDLMQQIAISFHAIHEIDISINKWGVVFLTMTYHCKFPRYFENKIEQPFIKQWEAGKLLVIVLIEN